MPIHQDISSSTSMSATETQQSAPVTCIEAEPTIAIPLLSEVNVRNSILMSVPESYGQNVSTPRTSRKTKDDIRYYFRPLPKEDIRIYFRPVSRLMPDRSRTPRVRTAPNAGKPKVRSRRVSPSGRASPSPGPEVPPKARERTSGQKNRDIFLAKQRESKTKNGLGRTNQLGSTALPGFDPNLAAQSTAVPTNPLSPRIIEVVDSSLMPSPLRNKADVAAESAPEYDDRAGKQEYHAFPSPPEYKPSNAQQYQRTALPHKPNSIYGTLPPLPVRLQRNNSHPSPQSPKLIRHRRQDTPYSPNDVGQNSALNSPDVPDRESNPPDQLGRSSSYASSDVLPTPVTLEEYTGQESNIVHGQVATVAQRETPFAADDANNNERDKTLKKAKSTETRLFRSRKSKAEKKNKERGEPKDKREPSQLVYVPQASQSVLEEPQDLLSKWDVAGQQPSQEIVRSGCPTTTVEVDYDPRNSDTMSDKMVVPDPPQTNTQTNQSSPTIAGAKAKKPNKLLRMLEAYSKNVEGLQMVQ